MSYPAINEHRMPYDIDGTAVGLNYTDAQNDYNFTGFEHGVASWLDSVSVGNLNREHKEQVWNENEVTAFYFFFPELREVNAFGYVCSALQDYQQTIVLVQGSADSTNGMDGVWETPVYTAPPYHVNIDHWRQYITTLSFSGPMKVIRISFSQLNTGWGWHHNLAPNHVHLYGRQAVGDRQDDIIFTDADGVELTGLLDFEDRPEATTLIKSFRVKNISATKVANLVNIQLNHTDFTISFSQDGPWASVLDIPSIGTGAVSNIIYVKNTLGNPPLLLGPYSARAIVTIGSWS